MTHVIIIRFHYPKGDKKFTWRFNHFKSKVLPRIRAQKGNQPFNIAIWCNPWHRKQLATCGEDIILFNTRKERNEHRRGYFIDFTKWRDVVGLKEYDIQSGVDSDDLIAPDYVRTIEQTIEKESGGKPMHLSFQPEYYDLRYKRKIPMKMRYHSKKGSMFLSIYQPETSGRKYIFAYEDSHLRIWRHFEKSVTIPAGKCWLTVHDLNESTKIRHGTNR